MRRSIFVFLCFAIALGLPAAGATISLPTAQQSLTVYIPPVTGVSEPWMGAADAEWLPIRARLNQKMATRSGPSTRYTEELGTVPQSTAIAVYWQEITGVPWAMVEFSRNGRLYRAYTGMKRIDADSEVPELAERLQRAVVVPDIRPYYGPGAQYEPVNHILRGGVIVEICCQEQGYALIDYLHPADSEKRMRSWVPMSALKILP